MGAVNDACDFADWALDPQGGNVQRDRLFFWTYPAPDPLIGAQHPHLQTYLDIPVANQPNWILDSQPGPPRADRAPTANEIARTADAAAAAANSLLLAGTTDCTRVLVFFAGHDLRAEEIGTDSRQTCFIANDFANARNRFLQGVVPCNSLRRILRDSGFSEALLFVDCCRTDIFFPSTQVQPLFNLNTDTELEGWSVGHATHQNHRAFETGPPNSRGAFSKTLMEGMRGLRYGPSQVLPVDRLEAYVTSNISRHTNHDQKPYFDYLPRTNPITIASGPPQIQLLPPGPIVRLARLAPVDVLEIVDQFGTVHWYGGPFPPGQTEVTVDPLPVGFYALRVVGSADRERLFNQPREKTIDAP